MYIKPEEVPLMKYSLYRVHKNLLLYVPPVFLLLGTVGNILSMIILTRRRMRKYSAYLFLAVLSGADLVVLHVGLLRLWLGQLTGLDVRNHSDSACKLIGLLGHTFSDYSGWLICAVTLERWLAVCHVFKVNMFGKKRRTLLTILILFVLVLVINAHFLWTIQITPQEYEGENFVRCGAGPQYKMLINEVWPFVDACIYSFLPFVLILVLNTLIIRQVISARRELVRMQQCQPGPRGMYSVRDGRPMPLRVGQVLRARESRKITLMLLTISFTFLLTTTPINLALIAKEFLPSTRDNIHQLITFNLVSTVTELLMYCNHSLNFFLYCATGAKFRHQLLYLFRLRGRGSTTSFLAAQELQSVDKKLRHKLVAYRAPAPKDGACSSSSSRPPGGGASGEGELFAGRNGLHRPGVTGSSSSSHRHLHHNGSAASGQARDDHSFPFLRNGNTGGFHDDISLPNRSASDRQPSDIIVGLDGHMTRRLRVSIGVPLQGTAL